MTRLQVDLRRRPLGSSAAADFRGFPHYAPNFVKYPAPLGPACRRCLSCWLYITVCVWGPLGRRSRGFSWTL
eukprot:1417150-Alexandrium_andersonii.AAC.1